MSYRMKRAAALVLCTAMTLLLSTTAESAPAMKCRQAVERAWTDAGVDKSDVVSTTARDRTAGGIKMPEANVSARLKSCSGMLVVNLTKMCQVRDVYTTGDCRLPGVSSYP